MKAESSIPYRVGEPMPGTKWVVRGKLGQGGMGLVLDVVKGEWIQGAMKVLLPPFAAVPEFAARFLDEVKVTAQLQHGNIVQLLDFDRLADGTPFMVMERLRGRTLRAALREMRLRGKAWSPANAYAVAAQVGDGLYRAHSHAPSIVHRDVKPENVYLHRAEASLESVVKVMDFGVAAMVGERDQRAIGTPRYMAPEQVSGEGVSPQTDQYALALVVYEMLAGRFPWDVDLRDAAAMAEVHLQVPPYPLSRFCPWVPERVDAALLRALSKDPGARHESVHGLLSELVALPWAGPRSAASSTDANSTDPMVGTLADGLATFREDHDTHEGISAPPVEGGPLDVPGLSVLSEVTFESGRDSSRGERAPKPIVRSEGEPRLPGALVASNTNAIGRARAAEATRAPMRKEEVSARLQPVDTPMTGESGRRSLVSTRPGRLGALGFLFAAAVALVITAAIAPWSQLPGAKASLPSESRSVGIGAANAEPVVQKQGASVAPSDLPGLSAAASPSPPLGIASAPIEKADGKPLVDHQGSVSAGRKVAPVRPAAHAAVKAKGHVPDDGRDELYVPEGR